ncbi:MAG: replication-relaxation family protein [Flavisolibacter sp.]
MNILYPSNDLDREGKILLALGDLYGLTIKQMMRLWGWSDYSKATIAFKKTVDAGLIYRNRRHGLGKETIPGDVYFLLSEGARHLQILDLQPTFFFELNKAKLIRPGGLEHTLLVNETIIKLTLFNQLSTSRLRLEDITHERSMRNEHKDAFKLYPDGFVEFLIKQGNKWNKRCFFLELEHTSAKDKEKWIAKVRNYINLFEYKLGTYFNTDRTFVLILTTDPNEAVYLRTATERTLTELGSEALTFRNWFCFGAFEQELSVLRFFASPRFYNPFNKAPVVPFPGLVVAPTNR